MLAEGRIERDTKHSKVPIVYLICSEVVDRGSLLRTLSVSESDPAWSEANLERADDVRRPDPRSGRHHPPV